MFSIKIISNDAAKPPGKLADAELHFDTTTLRALLTAVRQILDETATACLDRYVPSVVNQLGEAQNRLSDAQDAMTTYEALDGLKLVGFAIWERRTGAGWNRTVTFPAVLRLIADATAQDRIRDLILEAYAEYEHVKEPVKP